jgi:hypothetical protein
MKAQSLHAMAQQETAIFFRKATTRCIHKLPNICFATIAALGISLPAKADCLNDNLIRLHSEAYGLTSDQDFDLSRRIQMTRFRNGSDELPPFQNCIGGGYKKLNINGVAAYEINNDFNCLGYQFERPRNCGSGGDLCIKHQGRHFELTDTTQSDYDKIMKLLPQREVGGMHCSVNEGDNSIIFTAYKYTIYAVPYSLDSFVYREIRSGSAKTRKLPSF